MSVSNANDPADSRMAGSLSRIFGMWADSIALILSDGEIDDLSRETLAAMYRDMSHGAANVSEVI